MRIGFIKESANNYDLILQEIGKPIGSPSSRLIKRNYNKKKLIGQDFQFNTHKSQDAVGAKHSGDQFCCLTKIFVSECFALPWDRSDRDVSIFLKG
ncbi:MAG TPA: hypothetical protein DEG17_06540 [Cyanobacteria bacterium UBA11149]|nr:hypothetical protein [Cyanobacteria bacterium UBA11367]HBE57941.1 hypothetical protein [Cyanobacteria bacterium UBA11366]HBK66055.1 hypothetical protein [Cyanobacteria bacterium UBA11166]HBR74444.1 hypothetical protein [Cyanobacteria bacterium UBA11159]HBS68980.1 hypothetical protein [Cyanobacteria bacterium UBA11153]HBW88533.1 hypothetical protein [Cyanobacteria bacterium UBA11149]HCA93370.1 hypothetical protein [Cyanobacteria bacterium UBA9226]